MARAHSTLAALALLAASCSDNAQLSGFPTFGGTWAVTNFPDTGPSPTPMNPVLAFPNLAFDHPTFLTHSGDGSNRLFVTEQDGRIRVFPNTASATTASVFLDITGRVANPHDAEEGLLGLTFDPAYGTNGYFYVCYTAYGPRRDVISRFSVSTNPNVADASSEHILLEVEEPYGNHNGGMLAFGKDGMLYISLGDGGAGGDPLEAGQDRTTLLGKLLRIDPHSSTGSLNYGIPSDNPFVGLGAGTHEEIWAYGLRNPWRFSFDRVTGELWLGDVGQGTREEIDYIVKGGNYGWDVYEGNLEFENPFNDPPSSFHGPVLDYPRNLGASVTGGYVYRGTRLTNLIGAYLYADFGSGRVWAIVHDNGKLVTNTELANVSSVSTFGEDEAGEVYIVSYYNGLIWTLDPIGGGSNNPPALLSQTGVFTDTATLSLQRGVLEYSVNTPLWSDTAVKRRWIVLPQGRAIGFDPTGNWQLPVGTVLMKHFELEMVKGEASSRRRIETRFLVHETGGWAGYTYRWNAQQTDAELLPGAAQDVFTIVDPEAAGGQREQTWNYPSPTDCMQCHTEQAGHVLGPRTLQLNHTVSYAGYGRLPQLEYWNKIGMFSADIGSTAQYGTMPNPHDPSAPRAERARSYLAANCAMCHLPSGSTPVDIDLRYTTADGDTQLLDVRPTRGNLSLVDAFRIKPGVKESSVLWERMRRLDGTRMPPLGSHIVDEQAVQLLGSWIDSMQ